MDAEKWLNLGFAAAVAAYLLAVEMPRARREFSESLDRLGRHLDDLKTAVQEAIDKFDSK